MHRQPGGVLFLSEGYYKDFKSSAELELKYSVPGPYEISSYIFDIDDKSIDKIRVWYPSELENESKKYPMIMVVNASNVQAYKYEPFFMGSSAGAIMTAQYGTVISNPEYAALLSIDPAINVEQVSAVVVDDAPIDYQNMTLLCKMLVENYVKGSIYLNKDELNKYECIPYMTKDYPATFLLLRKWIN